MIPLGYLVIKRLEETRKKHSLGLVEATSLTSLDEAEPEAEYSLDSGYYITFRAGFISWTPTLSTRAENDVTITAW